MTEASSNLKKKVTLPVYSVTPFTMLDYPGHTACIVWFSGCNMRCSYCHNPQIVKGKGHQDTRDVLGFLERRAGILDGVVISGGEATLYPSLPAFVRVIKNMGYRVKIDTNGTRPDILLPLLDDRLIDYVALDYKAPFYKFQAVTRMKDFSGFYQTLTYLCQGNIPFEIRTTIHSSLLNENDINAIMDDLTAQKYIGTYYIQSYVNNGQPTLHSLPSSIPMDVCKLNTQRLFDIRFRN